MTLVPPPRCWEKPAWKLDKPCQFLPGDFGTNTSKARSPVRSVLVPSSDARSPVRSVLAPNASFDSFQILTDTWLALLVPRET